MAPLVRIFIVASFVLLAACAHTSTKPTGLPADVAERFTFHMNIEAQEQGYRTMRGESGVTVYASGGRITYGLSGDEIVAIFTIPNKSGANKNYYHKKQIELSALSDKLIDGARRRARDARDFAY